MWMELLMSTQFIPRSLDAEEVEALACKEGLSLAADWCRRSVIIESDCQALFSIFGRKRGERSGLRFVFEEALEAGRALPHWEFAHKRRERNKATHELQECNLVLE
ncbi:hypothetical protein C2845_PM05G21600 [Panicum miliaceum]|uniref:RNase H type-1 domain-containing protein n=1 Tax=Panicum miliaceum TaxID=4540 RepID=A0A3L6T0W2_PANMI|nr:hypothetical protein C2845_PM05G21600 [Panicum miliaceum]